MRRRSLIQAISVVGAAAAGRLLALYPPRAAVAAPTETPPGNGIGGMMGGMGEMMQAGNMMGPMRTGMELFMRHAQIRRTVTRFARRRACRHRIG